MIYEEFQLILPTNFQWILQIMTHSLDYWLFSVWMHPNLFYCSWYRMQRGYQTGRMGCTFLYCNEENDDKVRVVSYDVSRSSSTGWPEKFGQRIPIKRATLKRRLLCFKLQHRIIHEANTSFLLETAAIGITEREEKNDYE